MDWCLIALWVFESSTWSWVVDPNMWLMIFLVALGLGMVIFVHEFGHFVVAKLCGVKCEKFYLGFDIAGWKICRFRWGETEYGIGALPLGGYVKMLGQEDNPARLKEEIERAKSATAAGDRGQPIDLAAAQAALYDPRSYLAKSVPKRMAIISAGVIMNLVFAFLVAVVAYSVGVNEAPCEIGSVQPGYPAWEYDLRPGDRMVEINGKPTRRYQDLQAWIPLSRKDAGATIRIERPGHPQPIVLTIHPNREHLVPAIGVAGPHTTTLLKSAGWLNSDRLVPFLRNAPVARAKPSFALGDRIVKIDELEVATGPQLREALSARRAEPVKVTIQRTLDDGKTQQLTIEAPPRPMRRLGLVMEMGPITAIQNDSPVAEAGLKPDDLLVAVDGKPPGDPLTLPDRLWAMVNEAVARGQSPPTVTLTVKRKGRTLDIPVVLRKTDAFETPLFPGCPVSVPALGIAYSVLNTVVATVPDSPAAKADVQPGDVLLKATLLPPDDDSLEREGLKPGDVDSITYQFSDEKRNWPVFFEAMQRFTLPGSRVELQFTSGKTVTLVPEEVSDWFNPDRGFEMQPREYTLVARSFGEALKLGGEEIWEQALRVLCFLQRLLTGEISLKAIGGPVLIAQMAGAAVSQGIPELLMFLTTLSVMLAVINFLPIPVLDGGHFVFLLYEGIRGKPLDERIQVALSYVGLLLILALMVWALGLDSTLIPRE